MNARSAFLLDANVFIQAKNSYYGFDICPGFWSSLIARFEQGSIFSIDFIRQELLRGNDDLSAWVKNTLPSDFFLDSQQNDAIDNYREIVLWVQRNSQFFDLAKASFAASADGWLLAYAKARGFTVVTHEQLAPGARNKVPIPNLCEHFDIEYRDTFSMLRTLGIQFEWLGK